MQINPPLHYNGSNLEVVFSGGVVGVAVLQLWGVGVLQLWGLQCCGGYSAVLRLFELQCWICQQC